MDRRLQPTPSADAKIKCSPSQILSAEAGSRRWQTLVKIQEGERKEVGYTCLDWKSVNKIAMCQAQSNLRLFLFYGKVNWRNQKRKKGWGTPGWSLQIQSSWNVGKPSRSIQGTKDNSQVHYRWWFRVGKCFHAVVLRGRRQSIWPKGGFMQGDWRDSPLKDD